jgi:hypothetical protein
MRVIGFALLLVAGDTGAGLAQSSATGPDPVVTGDDRVVCRRVTRTATRMRVGRICRPLSEWRREAGGRAADLNDPNSTIDGAADTLDALGADDMSTNCIGSPLDRTPDTPLGPR